MPEATKNNEVLSHSRDELDNFDSAAGVIDRWIQTNWPSSSVIPEIHKTLLSGIESYSKKGITPQNPGEYRKVDLILPPHEPENFYVRGNDIKPAMRDFCYSLDRALKDLPREPKGNIGKIVHTAAWAYYIFGRIHPYLDGNGRTGRVILNRIVKGSGLEELIFMDTWFDQERETHLNALNLVDQLGTLAPLELYLLHTLANYRSNKDKIDEINNLIKAKEFEIINAKPGTSIIHLWDGFKGPDIAETTFDFESTSIKTTSDAA